jgi:hypothetical protein
VPIVHVPTETSRGLLLMLWIVLGVVVALGVGLPFFLLFTLRNFVPPPSLSVGWLVGAS